MFQYEKKPEPHLPQPATFVPKNMQKSQSISALPHSDAMAVGNLGQCHQKQPQ